jgi:hypothetical protein
MAVVIVYVLALSTVTWYCVLNVEAYVPVAPEKVTKSPVTQPWFVSVTVTVVVPLPANGSVLIVEVERIGVMS